MSSMAAPAVKSFKCAKNSDVDLLRPLSSAAGRIVSGIGCAVSRSARRGLALRVPAEIGYEWTTRDASVRFVPIANDAQAMACGQWLEGPPHARAGKYRSAHPTRTVTRRSR